VSRDTNFYYSFVVLPPAKRQAIVAVWDFCRAVDDVADEGRRESDESRVTSELARWRGELERCFDHHEPLTAEGRRLQPFVSQFNLPRKPFADLIDGVEMDVLHRRYETFDALHAYCLRVASAVGLIAVEIFGYRDPATRGYAVDLGVALQLTNIVRDIAVDGREGRLYLPLEDLQRFGVTECDLKKGVVSRGVTDLLAFECTRARSFYEKARRGLPSRDGRRLVAARIMAAIYHELLEEIERSGYDVFSRVIRVPRPRRALIAARTWAKVMIGAERTV
jgi:phytoene synthase